MAYVSVDGFKKNLEIPYKHILDKMNKRMVNKMVVKLKKPVFVEYSTSQYYRHPTRDGTIAEIVAVRFVKQPTYFGSKKYEVAPTKITLACEGSRNWNVNVPRQSMTAPNYELEFSNATQTKRPSPSKPKKAVKYEVASDIIGQDLRAGDIGFHTQLGQSCVIKGSHGDYRNRSNFRAVVEILEVVGKDLVKLRALWIPETTDKWLRKNGVDITTKIKRVGSQNIVRLDPNEVLPKLLENKLRS